MRLASCVFAVSCSVVLAFLCTAAESEDSRPTFRVSDKAFSSSFKVIAYGDPRFTDPKNHTATNPEVRRAIVARIASEKPDAILVSGDLPLNGAVKNDYDVFRDETKVWRDAHLRVYPALGNHELHGAPGVGVENWWSTFPELRNRRWYSVQLGTFAYVITLDSNLPLSEGSEQYKWLNAQLQAVRNAVDFVFVSLHHPPVADLQARRSDHNVRPNEVVLQQLLSKTAAESKARFIVIAGHIHNYERFVKDDVVYLVAGGGGAKPYDVIREKQDLYQSEKFPNYHYVEFTVEPKKVKAKMVRVADPGENPSKFEVADTFEVAAKRGPTTTD